jgi:hypothetical protein
MKAIEFKAEIKDGMIRIPEPYRDLAEKFAKVILLIEEDESQGQEAKTPSMETMIEHIRAWNVFGQIADPIEWQRRLAQQLNSLQEGLSPKKST